MFSWRVALRLAVAFTLAVGVTGMAKAEAKAPVCPPPDGGACYFTWIDTDGTSHTDNPTAGYCYQSPQTIAGANHTGRRVYLYGDRDCVGNSVKYVDPGLSWRDGSTVLWSYSLASS
ncbi:hypothetical protein [Streptomyces sp. UNOC14_S4]|uniref:hypothetical protein n=1 Tax=Streptomyces sp. UNOC14_S4 TaxID=2872340 RepID=UPI001E478D8A|nr:hypothetical protein [Streptomyces sp. UNOC14_S4]MCC3769966.1 hypothetical protein [Streptomyces sp. UNOC14_S4]